jgi:nucleoid-associated protein YgaU
MNDGQLTKLEFKAFTDKKLNSPASPASFVVPVNPESFGRNLKVKHEEKAAQGSQGTDLKYKGTEPEDIKFEFTLDGTKTIEGYEASLRNKPVDQQLDDLLRTVYYMNGAIHRPHYLRVIWGKHFTFDCVVTSLDVNYTLFDPSGTPLRAKISVSLKEHVEQNKRTRQEDKQSPDLTHVRTLNAGDSLQLMAYRLYGSKQLYLQAARANGLTSFRNLPAGQELVFPPIDKTANSGT